MSLRVLSLNVNGGNGPDEAEIPVKQVMSQLGDRQYDVALLQEFPEALMPAIHHMLPVGWHLRTWMLSETFHPGEKSMGLVTLSRHEISRTQHVLFPNPELRTSDSFRSHDKGALVVTLKPPRWTEPVQMANLHALPFHRFGLAEDSDTAASVWWSFETSLRQVIPQNESPVLVGGDFNACKRTVVDQVLAGWNLKPVFASTPTRGSGRTTDDFYVHVRGGKTGAMGPPTDVGSDHLMISVRVDPAPVSAPAMSSNRWQTYASARRG